MADPTTLGPYEIIELVRRGRSADAFLAHHGKMRLKRVLLRVLHEEVTGDAVFMQHFVAEAKAAAKLQHDCIASVIDLESESRPVYTVLEFVEGMDLAVLRESFGSAPPEVVASVACEVCRGLAYAHDAAVLHRRLRPRLIKVTPEGRVKILGFGVREKQSMVQPTAMILDVTHEEMFRSPEQVREEAEGPATDIYSLGVILFELLCGQMPFASLASYVTGEAAVRTPPKLRERNPLVPARLAALVERMLAPAAADRPASAADVRRELESLLEDRGDTPGPELLQAYLGNPADFAVSSRRRTIAEVMERASQLSRGLVAERAAALKELDLLLAAEPGYPAALALARQLRAAAPPVEVNEFDRTLIVSPPPADDPLATRILPPPEMDDPLATRILPPPEADDPLATRILPPETPAVRIRPVPVKPPATPSPPPAPPRPAPPAMPPHNRETAPPPPARPAASAASAARPAGRSPWPIVLAVLALGAAAGGVMLSRGCQGETTGVVAVTPPVSSAPAPATGSLLVSSLPPGARVTIGDAHASFLTDSTLGAIAAGTHTLHVERAGFLARDTSIVVVAGQEARMVLRLAPAPVQAVLCSLFVRVRPGANRVLVDSLPAAGGPELFSRGVAAGRHTLTVQAEGFNTSSQVINVPGAPRQTVVVVLQPSAAEKPDAQAGGADAGEVATNGGGIPMVVNVKPASDVFVDDGKVATHVTTVTVSLAAGAQHRIRVENPDFVPATRTVKAKAGSALKPLSVDLTLGEGGVFVTGPSQGLKIYVDDHFTGKTTPDRVMARAGAHDFSVRESNGTTIVASKRVIVDPDKSGGLRIEFAH